MKSFSGLGHEGHAVGSVRKYLWRRKAELVLKLLTLLLVSPSLHLWALP